MSTIPPLFGVHSEYDLFRSVCKLEEVLPICKKLGYEKVFLLDPTPVAWVKFVRMAREYGLKPIIALQDDETFLIPRNSRGVFELFKYHNGISHSLTENLIKIGEKDVPVIHVRYLHKSHRRCLDILSKMGESGEPFVAHHLPSPEEYLKLFNGRLFTRLIEIAESVEDYELKVSHIFPCSMDVEGIRSKCLERLEKVHKTEKRYLERLEMEIGQLSSLGMLDYIATIYEVVRTCREVGARTGPGRGSAVGSLVCFALGITDVDPLEYGLLFERFVNPARNEPPDIDIDVEDRKRQDVIEALRAKFGKYSVANVVTFGTMKERLLRNQIQRLGLSTLSQECARVLLDLPHHRSTHAAGVVLYGGDLREVLPLDEDGTVLLDMEDLQEMGMVKVDILGLRTLSFLEDVASRSGVKLDTIPLNDSKAFRILHDGLTCGIFQMESNTATRMARELKPTTLMELSDLIALNRPGPLQSGIFESYLNHKRSGKIEYIHPKLEEILSETWGTLVYQEQVMRIASTLGGLSPEESDVFRRAISKKDRALLARMEDRFVKGCVKNGMSDETARILFDSLFNFAGYAFNKSHSVAYAKITYWSCYLKAHHPEMFYEEFMKYHTGMPNKIWRAINEMRFMGIKVGMPHEENVVSIPPGCVKGVGPQLARKIAELMEESDDFETLIMRLKDHGVSIKVLENLIKSGLLDGFITCRKVALSRLNRLFSGVSSSLLFIQEKLFGVVENTEEEREFEVENTLERAFMECETMGFPLSLPSPPGELEKFRDIDLCTLSVRMCKGVIPFRAFKVGDVVIISDGKCAIAIRVEGEFPDTGVAFMDFSDRRKLVKVKEAPNEVLRYYSRIPKPEELLEAPEGNTVVVRRRGLKMIISQARSTLPPEDVELR